jgi:small subunit ribosomal protein S16
LKQRRIYDNLFAMLKMRLQRVGRKHQPAFRLVLTDSKNSTKSGRFKEILGFYDPRKITESLKTDRIKHWLSTGALTTATVHNLLVKKGVVRGKKIDIKAPGAPISTPSESQETPVSEPSSTEPIAPVTTESVPEPIVEVSSEESPTETA